VNREVRNGWAERAVDQEGAAHEREMDVEFDRHQGNGQPT